MTKNEMINGMEKVLDLIAKDYHYNELTEKEAEKVKQEFRHVAQGYNVLLNGMYKNNRHSFSKNIECHINTMLCK